MFKEGQRVIKIRRYSATVYCEYGGEEYEVPIGTKGTITGLFGEMGVRVNFDNGWIWRVSETELAPSRKRKFKVKFV